MVRAAALILLALAGPDQQLVDDTALIVEGQYFLGYCAAYISEADRMRMRKTFQEQWGVEEPTGKIRALGDKMYSDGFVEGGERKPSLAMCEGLMASVAKDMAEVTKRRSHK